MFVTPVHTGSRSDINEFDFQDLVVIQACNPRVPALDLLLIAGIRTGVLVWTRRAQSLAGSQLQGVS